MNKAFDPEYVIAVRVEGGQAALEEIVRHEDAERDRRPHACVYVALKNAKGEVYIQHRSAGKRLWPDRKTISASGHVEPGETFEQAARRELFEELGVQVEGLVYVGVVEGEEHSGPVYEAASDAVPSPNPQEVDVGRSGFVAADVVERAMSRREDFTPSGYKAIRLWLARERK